MRIVKVENFLQSYSTYLNVREIKVNSVKIGETGPFPAEIVINESVSPFKSIGS